MSESKKATYPNPVSAAASAVMAIVVVVVLAVSALLVSGGNAGVRSDTGASEASQASQVPAGNSAGTSSDVAPTGETTYVTVQVDGMSFTPSTLEVPAGNALVIDFENTGDQRHDLAFENGAATEALAPGDRTTLDVGVITANLEGWCTLPGHRQMGMTMQVIALGTAAGGTDSDSSMGPGSSMDHSAGMDHTNMGTAPSGTVAARSVPTMNDLLAEAERHDAHPATLEPLPEADGPTTHEYTFEVTEDEDALAEGIVRPIWTYNGTSPGPTLHGRVGDDFVVTLVNKGTMGHSVDFHAGENAPDEVMRTIEPGESLEYRFTAGRSGIWMYHCSTMPMSLHIANGMFGAVVIEPDGLAPVDKSYVLIQSEYYVDEAGAGFSSADKLAKKLPDVVMFNGRAFQYDAHPLEAKVGERVRFWVLDVGPNSPLSFHIVGTQFDTVWTEGAYSVYRGKSTDGITEGVTGAQVLPLIAAQGGFVELVAPERGTYPIVNHIMSLAEKGAHGLLKVD